VGSYEHGNENYGSIKTGDFLKFLDRLSEYWRLKKDSAPCGWLVGKSYL